MAREPGGAGEYGWRDYQDYASPALSGELTAGTFVGRAAEQARFRGMLLDLLGPHKGFFSSLLGSAPRKTKAPKTWPIQGRVVLVGGPPGSGKTRLTLRLREIARQDKEFTHRLRTIRLDWAEVFERDNRLTARLAGESLSPEILLDLLHNHCLRENGEPYFEAYRAAVGETATLAKTVKDAELQAVWEYRAQALGRGLQEWSYDRPLLFFLDNLYLTYPALQAILPSILEECGPQVFVILSGAETPPDLTGQIQPERLAVFEPAPFNLVELKALLELELLGNKASRRLNSEQPDAAALSPELLEQILEITSGLPLAGRLAAFLLQTGLSASELRPAAAANSTESLAALAEEFMAGPLGPGHPDRLKLYALAVLRRPEPGLLAALFDLRKDMLEIDETLERFNQRYAFLFEPGRPMSLHAALRPAFQQWLVNPQRRYDSAGLVKVNQHGLEYLDTRLQEWGANFSGLTARLGDLKWREWALDKLWHSFWLSEEVGWPVALSLLVAGLALRPAFARQVTALLEQAGQVGLLAEKGRQRLKLFRETVLKPPKECRPILREFRLMGQEANFFEKGLPQFAPELSALIEDLLR
jgi:hypothetical protein